MRTLPARDGPGPGDGRYPRFTHGAYFGEAVDSYRLLYRPIVGSGEQVGYLYRLRERRSVAA